jgi:hypothetical protein
LLGYGTMHSDSALENVAPRNVRNGGVLGNGGSTLLVTSCNDTGIVGSGVFCWVRLEILCIYIYIYRKLTEFGIFSQIPYFWVHTGSDFLQ